MAAKKASGAIDTRGMGKLGTAPAGLVAGYHRSLAIIIGTDHHDERTIERLEHMLGKLKKYGGKPEKAVTDWLKGYHERQEAAAVRVESIEKPADGAKAEG